MNRKLSNELVQRDKKADRTHFVVRFSPCAVKKQQIKASQPSVHNLFQTFKLLWAFLDGVSDYKVASRPRSYYLKHTHTVVL